MTRLATLVAAAFLALTGVAAAQDNSATVYRAKLAPVAAGATAPTGDAQLVDGKKNNIASVVVKGLATGTTYPWHVHEFTAGVTDPCAPGAAQGPVVSSFTFGTLTGNSHGDGFAKAGSPSFNWGPATNRYYVNIHNPETMAPIACGVLTRKRSIPHSRGQRPTVVYSAKLAPVAAGATAPTGDAQLVDGKKNNIASVVVKGLATGTTYPWHVHEFTAGVTDPCAPGAAQGPVVSSFTFGTLTGNSHGDGYAKAQSPSFNWGAATNRYYVNVHNPETMAPIACGVLTRQGA